MYLIFWFVVMCVLGVLSVPFISLLVYGIRKRSRLLKWLGAVPGVGLLALAVWVLFFCILGIHPSSDTTNKATIRQSFINNFGIQPGPDFVPLNQRIVGVADCGLMYLQFKAAESTFDKLRAQGFEHATDWEFYMATGGPYHPPWWRTNNPPSIIYYKHDHWKGPFNGNRAHMFYEPTSNVVYFCTEGSD